MKIKFKNHLLLKIYHAILNNPKNIHIFVVALLITCSMIAVLSWQSLESKESEYKRAESIIDNVGKLLEQETKDQFHVMDYLLLDTLDSIKERGNNYKWTEVEYSNLLKNRISYQPETEGLKIVDELGRYLGTETGTHPNTTLFDREYFQEHKRNPNSGLIISKPIRSKTTNNWVIALSRRRNKPNGDFAGIILSTIPLKYFENTFSKINLGVGGNISFFTFDDYSLIVRYPVIEDLIGKSMKAKSELYKKINESGKLSGIEVIKSGLDNVERMHKYTILKELNMIEVVGISKNEFLRPWFEKTILLYCLMLFLVISFWYVLIRFFLNQDTIELNRIKLLKSDKMAALGEMAGGIAHEINNPLAIVIGTTELILNELKKNKFNMEKLEPRLIKIDRMSKRIVKIIKGLKSFSRNADDDPMELVKLSLIIDDTLILCSEKFKNNATELTVHNSLDIDIECVPTQISQVLLNLLSNSFDAIQILSSKWVELRVEQQNESIFISITDSGNGIDSSLVDKIMQPFFTTKEVGKGTGLGLSISKGIIEKHQGKLSYDFTSKNTKFILEIPIRQSHSLKI